MLLLSASILSSIFVLSDTSFALVSFVVVAEESGIVVLSLFLESLHAIKDASTLMASNFSFF